MNMGPWEWRIIGALFGRLRNSILLQLLLVNHYPCLSFRKHNFDVIYKVQGHLKASYRTDIYDIRLLADKTCVCMTVNFVHYF